MRIRNSGTTAHHVYLTVDLCVDLNALKAAEIPEQWACLAAGYAQHGDAEAEAWIGALLGCALHAQAAGDQYLRKASLWQALHVLQTRVQLAERAATVDAGA